MLNVDEDGSLRRRQLLAANLNTSDHCLNASLRILAETCGQITETGKLKKGWRAQSAWGKDKELSGGGSCELKKKLYYSRAFCPNPKMESGRPKCQRLLPFNHTGKCPTCSHPTEHEHEGELHKVSIHHYINMAEYYKITFQTTDIAQSVVDYWPTSYSK